MSVLPQFLFSLMGCDLVAFSFSSTGHVVVSFLIQNYIKSIV
jgi:hypothetical protein